MLNAFFGEHRQLDVDYPENLNANLPIEELSPEKVAEAVKKLRSRKASGLDSYRDYWFHREGIPEGSSRVIRGSAAALYKRRYIPG